MKQYNLLTGQPETVQQKPAPPHQQNCSLERLEWRAMVEVCRKDWEMLKGGEWLDPRGYRKFLRVQIPYMMEIIRERGSIDWETFKYKKWES